MNEIKKKEEPSTNNEFSGFSNNYSISNEYFKENKKL